MMPAYFKNGENVTDRLPLPTKTAHFCRQISKMVNFENGTLTGTFLRTVSCKHWKMMKIGLYFQRFQSEATLFFLCRDISLASNSWRDCTELVTAEFSIVFITVPVSRERWLKFCYCHIFHHFQNVPALCERSFNVTFKLLTT